MPETRVHPVMESPQNLSSISHPGRPSSQGPDAVASAHLARPGPSQRPSLDPQHQPLPPSAYPRPLVSTFGWEIKSIIASSPNFHPVKRVHYTSPNAKVEIVIPEVERDGNPLIITGLNRHPRWPKSLFNLDWLKKNGDQNPTVRNVHNWADFKITMDDFVRKLHESPAYASADEQERLYGKDGDCPTPWTEWLTQSGAIPEDLLFHGSNDFLKFLPDKAKVQTLMCYMGIGDTFTPFHKDLCASSGQNLMCFSEHFGSAFWFMTKSAAAPQVAAYFHQLGQEVDLETHVVTIQELAKAPFDVYIAEQQLGDLVLVPPRSCHQVVNKGGITIKTSWSRMSLSGLQTALWHELPIYHRVCRQEIYKVKSNIFHAMQHFTKLTEDLPESRAGESCPTSTENLKQLVCLFDDILASEFSISRDSMPHVSQSEISHTDDLHCDFCGADIFQSFFECDSCLPASSSDASTGILPVGDGLVLCPSCYVEGRTCLCGEMQPVQCRPFSGLLRVRDRAIMAIERIDNNYSNVHGHLSEQPLRLLSGRDANVFEAACRLSQRQQIDTKAMRSCRVRLSHQVPAAAAIYCKSCHFSKCYTHLLELDSVHSVDAVILSDRYEGDADWHQSHRSGSQQYQEAEQRVIDDEERGFRPNTSHRLAYLAKTFTTCRPIAPEVTKYGWYDRFAQTTSIPIANAPAKALVGLPEEIDGDEPNDIHPSDESPLDNLSKSTLKGRDLQITDSGQTSTSPFASSTLLEATNEVRPVRQSSMSVIPDSDPTSPSPKSDTLQVVGSLTGTQQDMSTHNPLSVPCPPSSARQPPIVASLSSIVEDDPGNLSDLTDLPTEVDSSPRSLIVAIPISESSEQHLLLKFPHSSTSAPAASPATSSGPRSRLVFDCVEVPQRWYNGKQEKISPSSRQKRKRVSGPLSSDIAGLSSVQEISNQPSSKRKRKMPQGPASRQPPSSKRIPSSFDPQSSPPPSTPNNFLANALNQTFQLNSTSAASHVPTTTRSFDATPPVSITPTVQRQYRDFGVQKDPKFSRLTAPTQPSEQETSCIMRLQAENRGLRAEAETLKRERGMYRDNIDEINRLYNLVPRHGPPLPLSGPSNFTSNLPPEFSAHPRWRMRNTMTDTQFRSMRMQDADYPPIETLPVHTPSSPESNSATPRRKTPTEPRSLWMRACGDAQGNQMPPYSGPPYHGRRRGPADQINGRRRKGKQRGQSTFGRSGRPTGSSAPSSSSATLELVVTGASPKIDATVAQDHDKAPDEVLFSPASPVSDRAQPNSPAAP